MKIIIQTADFDVGAEVNKLRKAQHDVGAIVSFVGTVRDMSSGTVLSQLHVEHYPGMAEKSLENIVRLAIKKWEISDVVVIHRVGLLSVSEQIVLVAVASKHRGTAFSACEFIMDYLKTEAPFWKKEISEKDAQWVDVRTADESALNKWRNEEKPE